MTVSENSRFTFYGFLDFKRNLNMFSFIREVRSEIGKVTWPTKQDTIRLTLIVVAISVAVGLYLGGLDYVFTLMLKFLVS